MSNFKISAATSDATLCDLAEKWTNNILVVLLPGFYINNVSYKIWHVFTAEERMGIETCVYKSKSSLLGASIITLCCPNVVIMANRFEIWRRI